jgi:hypothetical protein
MADTRTLKLSLLADVNKFISGMNDAETSTKGLNSKIGKYSKAMAGAFLAVGAAAGAMAIKIGVDSVKAAIEDEASQNKLAQALRNTVDATDATIKSTEDYITRQQLAYGIADTKLRPALANLARATDDVGKAQQLTNLAMDISVATGKDLETVSLTLGKAYNGNFGALTKLGIPLDDAIKKSGDFNLVQQELTRLFGGAAAENTKTYAGQLAIVQQRFGELKEGIGVGLLPALKTLLEQVNMVAKGFSGEDPQGLSSRARELAGQMEGNGAYSLGGSIRELTKAFSGLFTTVTAGGDQTSSTLQTLADALNGIARGINAIASAYSKAKSLGGKVLDLLDLGMGQGEAFGPGGKYNGILNPNNPNFLGGRAIGGPVSGMNSYLVGENGPEIFTPNVGGRITANGGGGGTVINLNGIVDAESARRSIEQLIQRSARRTGAIDWVGATL